MKKYEKPYLEAEIINFVDICSSSNDIDNADDDFSNENTGN